MPRLPFLALLILSAGCTVGPDYRRPPPSVQPQWVEAATPGAVDNAWWRQFGDDRLTALIQRAMASSPQLAEARARISEARANRDAAAGGRLPNLAAGGSATENQLSENGQIPVARVPGFDRNFSLFDMGFDASWEIDLWGRRSRQVEGAAARTEAAIAGEQDVLVSLQAEIARTYFDLRAAQARLDNARATAGADATLAALTRQRFDAGEASRREAELAEAAARNSASAVPAQEAAAAAALYRIGVLVGQRPEEIGPQFRSPAPLPIGPQSILTGIRSDLLMRRPDVRRAERELAAATADVGVATADLFPRFSLLGSIGQQARNTGDLDSGGSTRFQIGPSFSWPIFSGGTVRARMRAAGARSDAAAARYEQAVLGALADSETAINHFLGTRSAAADAHAALERERAAFTLAEQRMRSGEDDRLALERARKTLLLSQERDLAARLALNDAAVALFKSLGGGWQAGGDQPATSP
jgi:NodT family efflux transporter outer membrane factor (OMF) lipoprotein